MLSLCAAGVLERLPRRQARDYVGRRLPSRVAAKLNFGETFWNPKRGVCRSLVKEGGGPAMLPLVLLGVLALVLFGLSFTLHWLFIVAVLLALLFLISLFMGAAGGRTRGFWW